jgi:hypothetical protein
MTFIRGDRSVTAYNQPATATTLRTTGLLYTPIDNPPPVINVPADKYESVNNFYASALDFSKLGITGGIQNAYYVWDPKLTTSSVSAYGYGGYQTFVWNGAGYDVVPGGGSYANGNTDIESGQAFFVKAVGSDGTLTFLESAKTTSSNLVTRNRNSDMAITTKLSVVSSGNTILIDGVVSRFGSRYLSLVDALDIRKISGTEGIGLIRDGIKLTAEFRKIITRVDTVFLYLNQLRTQTYQLDFSAVNTNSTSAVLVDTYLSTRTPIGLAAGAEILFTVTADPASSATGRFYLIITNGKTVHLKDTSNYSISTYPNPITANSFTVDIDNIKLGAYLIEIKNTLGISIVKKTVMHSVKHSTHTVNIQAGVLPGLYRVSVIGKDLEPLSTNIIIK